MRVVFLPQTDEDVRWFKRYYRRIFPEGSRQANAQMARTLTLLMEQPRLGHPAPEPGQLRLAIVGTPFLLTYRLNEDRIEILRVSDGRANPTRPTDQGFDQP
ncbi:MAG: type II toxin-antitoxin system RelE/ParE family toxin [Rhizobiaceae bacterium]|nr:type II toxin-antitoxin system RelE/ParE family toxin [Rhizobiaceae bacterium]